MRYALLTASLLAGCSLVNDPGVHMNGGMDGGSGMSDAAVDAPTPDAGADTGPGDAGPPPIEADQFCLRFAELACEAYETCCSEVLPTFDPAMCISMTSSGCSAAYGYLLTDSRTGYDEAIAGQVLEEGYDLLRGRNGSQMCDLDVLSWLVERDGFLRVFAGTRGGGVTCTPDRFEPFDQATLLSCTGGFSCLAGTPNWSCQQRADVGGACVLHWDCLDGLACIGTTLISFGRCSARLGNNAPCNTASDCQSLICGGEPRVCQGLTQDRVFCAFAAPG